MRCEILAAAEEGNKKAKQDYDEQKWPGTEEDCQLFGSLCYRMFGMDTSEIVLYPSKFFDQLYLSMDSYISIMKMIIIDAQYGL